MTNEELVLLELARRARLERGGFDISNKYGAAIFSVWKLLNIKNYPKRKNLVTNIPDVLKYYGLEDIDIGVSDDPTVEQIKFTAHSHTCGIMDQSPDDVALYLLIEDISAVNIIVDDFNCTII